MNRQNRKLINETSYKYSDTDAYIVRYVLHIFISVYFIHTNYSASAAAAAATATATNTMVYHCYYRSILIGSAEQRNSKQYKTGQCKRENEKKYICPMIVCVSLKMQCLIHLIFIALIKICESIKCE